MDIAVLNRAVEDAAALRRRQRLQPAGGRGEKIFPPTYPGERGTPTHVFERRRLEGEDRVCVLVDSVQSQANRLEEALLAAAETGAIRLPRLVVDFSAAGLNAVGQISDLQAPHRVFDAILRDSKLGGARLLDSDLGQRLRKATPADASALLEASPASLLFGAWNSTGEGGGLGAKFARVLVSEVIGVDVPVEEVRDGREGRLELRNAGRRPSSRIDPLGIPRSIEIYTDGANWDLDPAKLGDKTKKVRPSEINHGNIAPSVQELGVTCDYALQTQVLSFAGLRRLRFGNDAARDRAARAWLAALGLVAMIEGNRQGMALRSRCDLVCEGGLAPIEIVGFDGEAVTVAISPEEACALAEAAFEAARAAGFALDATPRLLQPQEKLLELVRLSQQRALGGEGMADEPE